MAGPGRHGREWCVCGTFSPVIEDTGERGPMSECPLFGVTRHARGSIAPHALHRPRRSGLPPVRRMGDRAMIVRAREGNRRGNGREQGSAGQGVAGRGKAGLGRAGSVARQGEAKPGWAGQGMEAEPGGRKHAPRAPRIARKAASVMREWLLEHTDMAVAARGIRRLRMRAHGDHRHDDKLKAEWLQEVRDGGRDVTLAFEDRQRVVDMWRANGVPCFQVAPGDF